MNIKKTNNLALVVAIIVLLVYILITIIDRSRNNGSLSTIIEEEKGKNLCMSDSLKRIENDTSKVRLLIYIENFTCTPCVEKNLASLTYMLDDNYPLIRPLIVFHNEKDLSDKEIEKMKNVFSERYQVAITRNDSIRALNNWLPNYWLFYSFIVDKTYTILYAGFIDVEKTKQLLDLYLKN